MELILDKSLLLKYNNNSQKIRIATESWVFSNVYCPSCGCDRLDKFPNNSPVADFYCKNCMSQYELKSKRSTFTQRVADGAYTTMIKRINSNDNPHFFFLNYSPKEMYVHNFFVVPKHYFVSDIIEKRKPLTTNAKRAGWIGCNINTTDIPESGKIYLINKGEAIDKIKVLESWSKTAFLAHQKIEARGWLLSILQIVDCLSENFTLEQIYNFENKLKLKFPDNNFIKDKIRQQLQILRDKGYIIFNGGGHYSKKK